MEGLGEVGSIVVEVIRVTAYSLPQFTKEKCMECLVDEGWQLEKWRLMWTEV